MERERASKRKKNRERGGEREREMRSVCPFNLKVSQIRMPQLIL